VKRLEQLRKQMSDETIEAIESHQENFEN